MKNVDTVNKTIIVAVVFVLAFVLYLLLANPEIPVSIEEEPAETVDSTNKFENDIPISEPEANSETQESITQKTQASLPSLDSFDEMGLEQESAGIQEGIDLLNNPLQ